MIELKYRYHTCFKFLMIISNLSKTMPISHQISSVTTDVTVTTRTRQNVWLIHYPFIFFETNFYSFVCNIIETAASSSIKFKIFYISWGHFSEKEVNHTNTTLEIGYLKKSLKHYLFNGIVQFSWISNFPNSLRCFMIHHYGFICFFLIRFLHLKS